MKQDIHALAQRLTEQTVPAQATVIRLSLS